MHRSLRKALSMIAAVALLSALAQNPVSAVAEGDWEYRIDGKNAVITRYNGANANPIVPAKLGGKPVTAIASDTFGGCAITTLTLSANIKDVEAGAFFECKTITDILVDSANPVFTSAGGVLFRDGGKKLVQYPAGNSQPSYDIPDGVVELNTNAFDHNFFLTRITIPESVTAIGIGAFWRCNALTAIRIPAAVTSIGNSAFANCNSLRSIEVAKDNPNYKSDGFALFSKDGKHLMQCPASAADTYTVPDGVTALDEGSFRGCILLRSVMIGDSVKQIGACAFAFCETLSSATFGKNIESIGRSAFDGCNMLESAYFQGAPPAKLDESAFAGCAQGFTVYYPENKKKAWAKFKAYPAKPYSKLPEPTATPTPQPTATATPAPAPTATAQTGRPETAGKPELKSADQLKNGCVRLIWTHVPGASYYEVYRSTAFLGKYERIRTTMSSRCMITAPEGAKRYCYRVRAVSRAGSALILGKHSNIMYASRVRFPPPN